MRRLFALVLAVLSGSLLPSSAAAQQGIPPYQSECPRTFGMSGPLSDEAYESYQITVEVGSASFGYRVDRTSGTVELLGQTFALDELNVIVVDNADGAAEIAGTLRIDPRLPLTPRDGQRRLATLDELRAWLSRPQGTSSTFPRVSPASR